MIRRVLSIAMATLTVVLLAASSSIVVSGQVLAYQDGYVFFTTGDGFRVAHGVAIRDAKTGASTTIHPAPRIWARATFDPSGAVTELDLSRTALPPEGSFADVARFAVAASSPIPNPGSDCLRGHAGARCVGCVDRAVLRKTGARHVYRAGASKHALYVEHLHHDRCERLERSSDSDGSCRCAPL